MSEPFPSDRITGPDYISVADAHKAIIKAREEGRREGLGQAERAIVSRINGMKAEIDEAGGKVGQADVAFMEGQEDAMSVIRALKEKQPCPTTSR